VPLQLASKPSLSTKDFDGTNREILDCQSLNSLQRFKITDNLNFVSIVKNRTYLKNNLSAHGSVAKCFKMLIRQRSLADSAFPPVRAHDSRDFAKLNLLFVEP